MFQFSSMSIYAEKIKNYEVSIQINKNGTLTVNEVIDYEFDEKLKHGIYRDIPLNYKKLGFEIEGCQARGACSAEGEFLEVYLMGKLID